MRLSIPFYLFGRNHCLVLYQTPIARPLRISLIVITLLTLALFGAPEDGQAISGWAAPRLNRAASRSGDSLEAAPANLIDFDDLEPGTRVRDQYAGLRSARFLNDEYPVYPSYRSSPTIVTHANAPSQPQALVNDFSNLGEHSSQGVSLVIYFEQPMAGVEMVLGTVSCDERPIQATVSAYNAAGEQMDAQQVEVSEAFNTQVMIDDSQKSIRRVVVDYGSTTCPEAIDNLSFTEGDGQYEDNTPPQVTIQSPPKNLIAATSDWAFQGQVFEAGVLTSVRLNGRPLPVYMVNPQGVYAFDIPLTLKDGVNSEAVVAKDEMERLGSDVALYGLGIPSTIWVTDLHLSQRGVVKLGKCDIDVPFVAGKKMLVQIGLKVQTAGGVDTTISRLDLNLYRKTSSGETLVNTLPGYGYPNGTLVTTQQMKNILFWIPGKDLDTPGQYRLEFQPYFGSSPIGSPLTPQCSASGYETVYDTEFLRLLFVPVEASMYSPKLSGTQSKKYFLKNLDQIIRTWPVRDPNGIYPGLVYKETNPFKMCNGSSLSASTYPNYCLSTGWVWKHIDKDPNGELMRAVDSTVYDQSTTYCNSSDHIVGGVINTTQTQTYSFDPALGVFRPGAHPCWQGAKHYTPMDENHNGTIDDQDLAKFIASFYDKQLGQWLAFPNIYYEMGETFRQFFDLNGNKCNDVSTDTQSPIRQKGDHKTILWGPQADALDSINSQIYWVLGITNFYNSAVLLFPDTFVVEDSRFGAIGPGSAGRGKRLAWTRADWDYVLTHEVGHSYGGLYDLYLDNDPSNPSTWDNLFIKELAMGMYSDYTYIAPWNVCTVMGSCQSPKSMVHYLADYFSLFTLLSVGSSPKAALVAQEDQLFSLTGLVDYAGNVSNLHNELVAGLDASPIDPASPYALVFGTGGTVLLNYPFQMGGEFLPPEGDSNWPGQTEFFSVNAPYPDGTEWVELQYSESPLARWQPSANPPQLEVLEPQGGEAFGAYDQVAISWSSMDPDSDTLLHSIYYSHDGGENWDLVASGLGGSWFEWDLSNMAGTQGEQGLIRVIASDGFHLGIGQSQAFIVEPKPPIAAIISPEPGQAFLQCGRVHLRGAAQDLEEDISEVAWTQSDGAWASNRGPGLSSKESGLELEQDIGPLSAGEHTVSLTVTDANGGQDSDEVTFTVLADTDCDGMSDDYEARYGLQYDNPEDTDLDSDGDGVINLDEYRYGLNPSNLDTDGDGYSDGFEMEHGSDPNDPSDPMSIPVRKIFFPLIMK